VWFFTPEGDRIPRDTQPTYWQLPENSDPEKAREIGDGLKSTGEELPPADPLYAWVDAHPAPADRLFSPGRATRLFAAIMLSAILVGLPLLVLRVGLLAFENEKKEALRQEQLREDWKGAEKAVREGKAGEATQRLFGVKKPKPRPEKIAPKAIEP